MFNSYQIEHMKHLQRIPPENRCWCGWNLLGDCYNCKNDGRTLADRLAEQCPVCGADKGYHRVWCPLPGKNEVGGK